MTTILVAADAKWVRDQVRAAFMGRGQTVVEVTRGQDVRDTFAEIAGPEWAPEIDAAWREILMRIAHALR